LQLKMGRTAHVLGITSGLALALTALVNYGLVNWDFLADMPEYLLDLKWIIPLATGIAVAVATIVVKWEPYVADRNEPHFVMSVAGLIVPTVFLALFLFDQTDILLLNTPTWLYPISILGISLTLISLAMTWEGGSSRKTMSIAASVVPIVLLSLPVVYQEDPDPAILAMLYLGCAVLVQLSGSMLHIIASSTSVQQREVLKASDSKLKEQAAELEKKRVAIAYREDALRSKESELEVYEKRLANELGLIEDQRSQVSSLERDIEQRLEGARATREEIARKEAELEREEELLRMKFADVEEQKQQYERMARALVAKEGALATRERDANKLLIDAQSKDREVKNRLADIAAEQRALDADWKELETKEVTLAQREKQIDMREGSVEIKDIEMTAAREQLGKVALERTTVRNLEQQLLMKEEALAENVLKLKSLEEELRKKAEKAERLSARADQQMNELVEKESALVAREKQLGEKEAELKAELESFNARLEETERTRTAVTDREKQYRELTDATRTKMTSLSSREEEVTRKMDALGKREQKIKELDQSLRLEREKTESKLRNLLEKEKDLEAEEAEIGLKHAELKAMEREVLERVDDFEQARAGEPSEVEEGFKALAVKEQHLQDREREMKARLYQREKELEKKETSLRAQLQKDIEAVEEAVEEEYAGEKVKTGIERLDDLLLGGMPFGSNVLCVGPPFIGKEVAMLLFVAEGLRKGVPAVIVTTSHSPTEVAKQMAPILPTFMEFQQLGLVGWIDASGQQVDDPSGLMDDYVVKVSGPGDFQGILSALEGFSKAFEKQKIPYFRMIYLSLSMSITQSDEKTAFQYVQTLAGRMKQMGGVSLIAVERGMHTEQQLESIQHHMSGALQFKTEKQKTLVGVQGVCDVQTREWIEYRHTNKAIMIGAFSLERIR